MPGVLIVEALAQSGGDPRAQRSGRGPDASVRADRIGQSALSAARNPGRSAAHGSKNSEISSAAVADAGGGERRRRVGGRGGIVRDGSRGASSIAGRIHSSAVIDQRAELDTSVEVGPGAVIGPDVKIGAGSVIGRERRHRISHYYRPAQSNLPVRRSRLRDAGFEISRRAGDARDWRRQHDSRVHARFIAGPKLAGCAR